MALTRKQIQEGLTQVPIDRLFNVSGQLTGKQKRFAAELAAGSTKAGAYRKVYSPTAKPKTAGDAGYRLSTDSRIINEVEAYRLASEAAKHRTASQLRDLVIQSLVQVVIDPEAKHSAKISAARILGTVTEVAAFTERKETRVITSSATARDMIMQQLRDMMKAGASDAIEVDAAELLQELSPTLDEVVQDDPTQDPTPDSGGKESHPCIHTIPLKGLKISVEGSENDPTPTENSDSYNAR